jgi:hypothetical protein
VADVADVSGRTMTTPMRFAYADAAAGRTDGSRLAYVPITLRHATHVLAVVGLLNTGSTVNVLPYPLGCSPETDTSPVR